MRKYANFLVSRPLVICIGILTASSVLAAAQHEQVLYAFGANSADGRLPEGVLIADAVGNLYGTTEGGGAGNAGTVYELSPPTAGSRWTETVLYAFSGGSDGIAPIGNLVFDSAGNLYGVTDAGGDPSCQFGCGTVFELSLPAKPSGNWTKTTIYMFGGGNDGDMPTGGVVFDRAGNLYGTTEEGGIGSCGGSPGCGTVFELSPASGGAWTETVLYSFTGGSDGAFPDAPPVLDKAGTLYGTASAGGNKNCEEELGCGTVFELTPGASGWTETVLHTFGVSDGDGTNPAFAGLLVTATGALVGTTPLGGTYGYGTVFGLRPPSLPNGQWLYGVLYSFGMALNDGAAPRGGVISVGSNVLYGTTQGGGVDGTGTVFQLTRVQGVVWKETGLYSFGSGLTGAVPSAGLLVHNGALFGTTAQGGSKSNAGTVFKVAP
jgi:uncharacterized repeat protein (TIGR03803 family)